MLRFLATTTLHLIANALGLLIAAATLSGLSINGLSFIAVVVLFTVVEVVLGPLLAQIANRNVPVLSGGIALVTTFVGLAVTDFFSTGLTITGLDTWIIAPLIIWVCTVLAAIILPLFLFKKVLQNRSEQRQ